MNIYETAQKKNNMNTAVQDVYSLYYREKYMCAVYDRDR